MDGLGWGWGLGVTDLVTFSFQFKIHEMSFIGTVYILFAPLSYTIILTAKIQLILES